MTDEEIALILKENGLSDRELRRVDKLCRTHGKEILERFGPRRWLASGVNASDIIGSPGESLPNNTHFLAWSREDDL